MTDVFLSYTSRDRPRAAQIAAALAACGFDVFWDQDVPPGRDWNSWIGERLTAARCVVVLWSKASAASRNVVHEATIALERGALVPVLIEDMSSTDYPMGFYTTQAADLRGFCGDDMPGLRALVAAIGERLGRPTPHRSKVSLPAPITKLAQAEAKAATAHKAGWMFWGAALAGFLVAGALIVVGTNAFLAQVRKPAPPGQTAPIAPLLPEGVGVSPATELEGIDKLVGRWDWGRGCTDPSVVKLEDGRLTFTTKESVFVHDVGVATLAGVDTTVISPQAFAGAVYRFTRDGDALTVIQVSPARDANTWVRCP